MFLREIEIQQIGKGAMFYALLPAKRTSALHYTLQNDKSTIAFYSNKETNIISIDASQ